jgi:hypothetical protein
VNSPTSNHIEDPTFWVPGAVGGHCSDGKLKANYSRVSEKITFLPSDVEADDSDPQTPTSPTSSNRSFTLSVNSIPIVRSDKHVVLTSTSPARPKVASMQAKLDHTKIDTSLYQQVKSTAKLIFSLSIRAVFRLQNSPQRHPSMASEDLRGTLHFSMLYDPIAGILTVRLIEVIFGFNEIPLTLIARFIGHASGSGLATARL